MKKNPYKHGDKLDLFGLKYVYIGRSNEFELARETQNHPLNYPAPRYIEWDEKAQCWRSRGYNGSTPRTVFLKVLRGERAGLKQAMEEHEGYFNIVKSRFDALEKALKESKTK